MQPLCPIRSGQYHVRRTAPARIRRRLSLRRARHAADHSDLRRFVPCPSSLYHMSEALSPYIIARHYIAARIARYVPCRLRYPACLTRAMHTMRDAQARLRGQGDLPSARRPLCSIRPDGQRPSPTAPALSSARNGSHAVRARHITGVPVQRMTYYTPPAGRACHALPRRNKRAVRLTPRRNRCAARLMSRRNKHATHLTSRRNKHTTRLTPRRK